MSVQMSFLGKHFATISTFGRFVDLQVQVDLLKRSNSMLKQSGVVSVLINIWFGEV